MLSNHRHIRLEDRDCPNCQSDVVTICKDNEDGEKFWFNCAAPAEECGWGRDTPTHRSEGSRVSPEEARNQFDKNYK